MKNGTQYEKKLRKFLGSLPRKSSGKKPEGLAAFTFLLQAILEAEAQRKAAENVLDAFEKEFVDYNELRVAPVKDILDCTGRDFPAGREKAESILKALNAIFDRSGALSMDYMNKMPKRDLRRHLQESGLSLYASAAVVQTLFDGHAIPVDYALSDLLEMEKMVHPGSSLEDVQGFLERVIPQKDAAAAHLFFRDQVEKNYKVLSKKRRETFAAQVSAGGKAVQEVRELSPEEELAMDRQDIDADFEAEEARTAKRIQKATREGKIAPPKGVKPKPPQKK